METVLRGIAVYVFLLAITRLSGRRTMAQMTPFDFVLLLLVAETTQQALLADDYSLTNAVVLIVTLFGFDIVLSYVKRHLESVDGLIDGRPTLLVVHGEVDEQTLRRTRVGLDDILSAAREKQGLGNLTQVKYAVLETTGNISIIAEEAPHWAAPRDAGRTMDR